MPTLDIMEILEDKTDLSPAPRIVHVLEHGVDWENRTVHLNGDITPDLGGWLWGILDYWAGEPVTLNLSTDGGDVGAMFEMHSAIRRHGDVTVTAYGLVASAGVLVLAACHRRIVTETIAVMSHESSGYGGDVGYRAAKDRRAYDEWQHKTWCNLMGRYTNRDEKWWDRTTMRKGELWLLGGEEVVEHGLADEVI